MGRAHIHTSKVNPRHVTSGDLHESFFRHSSQKVHKYFEVSNRHFEIAGRLFIRDQCYFSEQSCS